MKRKTDTLDEEPRGVALNGRKGSTSSLFSKALPPAGSPFDGPLLEPQDHARLGLQLAAVRDLMSDGRWRTLAEIALAVGAPEASVSARLRDLRKPKHGSRTVSRRREGNLYRYSVRP